jgi:hypothetical protein
MVLDSTNWIPPEVIGKLDEDQYQWLEQELKSIHHQFICIVSHIPSCLFVQFFFDKRNRIDLKIQRNLMHSDFLRIKKLHTVPQHPHLHRGHVHLQDELPTWIKYWTGQYVAIGGMEVSRNFLRHMQWWNYLTMDRLRELFIITREALLQVSTTLILFYSPNSPLRFSSFLLPL